MSNAATPANWGRQKQVPDPTPGPWTKWRTRSRHARAIRFIETFCPPPKGHGAGRPLKLARFQKDWLEEVYSPDVEAAVQAIPRGNGKSTFRAAVSLHAIFDPWGPGAPQVPIVATTVGQAIRSIYGVAVDMVGASPELANRCIPFTAWGATRLFVPSTGGEMFPIANQVEGLQGLDPSLAVVDELAFMPVDAWQSLVLASGKRPHSLVIGISTPGLDRDNALWAVRERALTGGPIPGFRYSEYAADEGCDIRDEAQWRKANPAIAARFLRIAALRTAVEISPESHFRVFRLGQWVSGLECWLGPDGRRTWDGMRDPWELVPGAPTWAGVDVGIKRDSTAVVVVQRRPDGRLHARARIWTPTKGEPVDVTDVMHHLRELDAAYRLEAVSFDPRFFDVPAKMLGDSGLPMVEIPQSVERMTPACGSALELARGGRLSHDGDEAFAMQVLNAVPRYNERGLTLAKAKSRGRIDACIALVLAVDRALREETPVRRPVAVW